MAAETTERLTWQDYRLEGEPLSVEVDGFVEAYATMRALYRLTRHLEERGVLPPRPEDWVRTAWEARDPDDGAWVDMALADESMMYYLSQLIDEDDDQ
jgi:hypothetical protein